MGIGKYCLNCGYVFRGQRTGKCPNCDQSAYTEKEGHYILSPQAVRQFEDFDRKGGNLFSLLFHNKKIALIQTAPNNKWVSLSVLGAMITYADYGQGPEVIASLPNRDGFGIKDIPSGLLAEAIQMADEIIHDH